VIRGQEGDRNHDRNLRPAPISIACVSAEGGQAAKAYRRHYSRCRSGARVRRHRTKLLDLGNWQLLPGKERLLHISQIANERVNNVSDISKRASR